ncbi:hypothetical protein ON010_g10422 [Phytophthora cinnamomi]|nr:hypothetical protein ON010_g10422 [Phytophthora cinnamomi]
MRLFPTDQNTGGFFVAVLRKVRDASLPGKTQRGLDSYEVAATISGERRPSRRVKKLVEQGIELPQLVEAIEQPAKVENQTYSKLRADHWEEIKEFYGISGSFPQILDTGLRVFARVQAAGKLVFRPTDEGLERVLPFISNRKAPATIADLVAIVTVPANNTKQVALGLEHFSEPLQEAAAAVREDSGVGPMLMVLPLSEVNARQLPAALPVWLGDKTLTLLVDKHTRDRLAHKSRE